MALSGTINGTTSNSRVVCKLDWTATQNTASNYSDVTVTLKYSRTNSGYTTDGAWSGSITINGTKTEGSKANLVITQNSNSVAMSATTRVAHNEDGTKSITISATGSIPVASLDNTSVSGTITLDAIQRASQPSCVTWPNTTENVGNIGSAFTIHMNRKSSSFTHTVRYEWGSKSGTISTGVTNNVYWTIPNDFCNDVATYSKTKQGTIYVDTYNGSTQVGTKSVTFTAALPESTSKPNVSISVSPENTNIPSAVRSNFTGIYVKGYSKVSVAVTASGKYSATISAISTAIGSQRLSGSSVTSGVITSNGSLTVTTTVTDSRGFTNSTTQSITIMDYAAPTIQNIAGENEIKCYRSSASGVAQNDGINICIKAKKSFVPLTVSGVQKNYCALRYRVALQGGSFGQWTDLIARTGQGNEYSGVISETVQTTSTAVVEIMAIDDLGGSSTVAFSIPTESVPLHLGNGGTTVGIGRYANTSNPNSVSIGWDTYFDDDIYLKVNGNYITLAQYIQSIIS